MSEMSNPAEVPEWNLADRLRKTLREPKQGEPISVQAMADELGFSRKTIGDYLNGRLVPRTGILKAWAVRTGWPASWIETGQVAHPRPDGGGDVVILPFGWLSEAA